jgi:hypothetical protein
MHLTFAPRSLTQGFSLQQVGQETLVYDEQRHRAYCLDAVASAVWQLSNGERTISAIAEEAGLQVGRAVDTDAVLVALAQLDKNGLLAHRQMQGDAPDLVAAGELSRRAMIGRLGVGAALIVPVVAAIAAPRAAQALSGIVTGAVPPRGQAMRNYQQSQSPSK